MIFEEAEEEPIWCGLEEEGVGVVEDDALLSGVSGVGGVSEPPGADTDGWGPCVAAAAACDITLPPPPPPLLARGRC